MQQRRNHSDTFKAKVALEAVKGIKTINEIASKFQIHPNQVTKWKKELLAELPSLFSKKRGRKKREPDEQEKDNLFREIGKLKVEVETLKKNAEFLQ